MKCFITQVYVLVLLILRTNCAVLKTISNQDLNFVINANEYLLVIFVEPDCQPCKNAEIEIGQLATSISESLIEVTFIRVASTEIPRSFGISSKPTILFYRHTKPIIYDGLTLAPDIEEWISQNLESSLKILTENNFEHLTQAATGATTGDWMVGFCDSTLKSCQNLQAILDTAATKLSGQQNVAYVDTATNPLLVERFSLHKDFSILFFRLGKMYEYSIDKIDIATLTSFAQGWYKNFESKSIPIPPSPFDQLVTSIAQIIKHHYTIVWTSMGCIALLLLALLWRRPAAVDSRKKQ